ncbi:Thioredoxin-like protein AAED1 [Lachnellula suecica]|uniref:Thioredoxin-like protein AAED1 n=1 Tax=Lachnellula suecica TaxID=602035 RepID=A0A8T9CBU3_9HELO|nr:Thioredoxin-like protein AAED1 [Lachnellula suecica]
MAISSDSPAAREPAAAVIPSDTPKTNGEEKKLSRTPTSSLDNSKASEPKHADGVDNTAEFNGDVNTNNEIPSQETLRKVEGLTLLDENSKTVQFKELYNGPNVARRVLVIFIRHFFCGNCQEYIRAIASSISTTDLLQLPTPTFIAVVGCGSPSLISMYKQETSCPFPVYADPTKKLYDELGMLRTLNLGSRPEYMRRSLMSAMAGSFVQSLKQMKGGKAFQGGDYQQVGGEFLFEPVNMSTPICSPDVANGDNEAKKLGEVGNGNLGSGDYLEEKRVTWCHRMRNTRDHAEIPELREVLGFDGEGIPGQNRKRWTRALGERKGTGLTDRSSMSVTRNGGASGRQSSEILINNSQMVR